MATSKEQTAWERAEKIKKADDERKRQEEKRETPYRKAMREHGFKPKQ